LLIRKRRGHCFYQKFDFRFFGISGRLSSHDYAAAAALGLVGVAFDGFFGRALEHELDVLVVERGALDMRDGFDLLGHLVALRFCDGLKSIRRQIKFIADEEDGRLRTVVADFCDPVFRDVV